MRRDDDPENQGRVVPFPPVERARTQPDGQKFDALLLDLQRALYEGFAAADDDAWTEQDKAALHDERAFKARFGFVRNRRDRERLIRFKHTRDLTDDEIRALQHVGQLMFKDHGVVLVSLPWMAAFGYLAIGMIALLTADAWARVTQFAHPSVFMLLKLMAVTLVLLGMGMMVHYTHIRPQSLVRRIRRRQPS